MYISPKSRQSKANVKEELSYTVEATPPRHRTDGFVDLSKTRAFFIAPEIYPETAAVVPSSTHATWVQVIVGVYTAYITQVVVYNLKADSMLCSQI